jgi:CDP-glycerol glycerophosphotransferase (TagB/SpsB family)
VTKAQHFFKPNLMLAPADMMRDHFCRAFRIAEESCVEAGYPRVEAAFNAEISNLARKFGNYSEFESIRSRHQRVLFYMPTWRDAGHSSLAKALTDLDRLNDQLKLTDSFLYLKPHPNEKFSLGFDYSNVKLWHATIDFYPILSEIDVLVTDFSSIYYDYIAACSGDVWLYIYDYEDYVAYSRELAYPFHDNVDGKILKTEDDLFAAIASPGDPAAVVCDKRERLLQKFWGTNRDGSCERIASRVIQEIARAANRGVQEIEVVDERR